MNYRRIYEQLIQVSKSKNRICSDVEYFESHHIIPDFMFINRRRNVRKELYGHIPGDSNSSNNLVLLTPREHLIAHMLLCKIYRGTTYEWACLSSLLIMMNGGQIGSRLKLNRQVLNDSIGKAKLYQSMKSKARLALSQKYKGKIMAKDLVTGEILGMVDKTHPKVISGEWCHHSKGKTHSVDHNTKIKIATSGLKNGNAKEYTDEVLMNSYIEACKKAGALVSYNLWVAHSKKIGLPQCQFIKGSFRFEGKGFQGMVSTTEAKLGLKRNTNRKFSKTLMTLWQ